MSITVSCPCGQALSVPDDGGGKTFSCPKCQSRFTVRAPGPSPASPPAIPQGPPPLPSPGAWSPSSPYPPPLPHSTALTASPHNPPQSGRNPEQSGETFRFQDDRRDGVNFSATRCLLDLPLVGGDIRSLAYGADHRTALAADEETVFFLDLKAGRALECPPGPHRAPIACQTYYPPSLRYSPFWVAGSAHLPALRDRFAYEPDTVPFRLAPGRGDSE